MVYLAPSLSRLSNTPNLERHECLCPEETLKKSQASYKWVASDSKSVSFRWAVWIFFRKHVKTARRKLTVVGQPFNGETT
jgi:hypothetical protein